LRRLLPRTQDVQPDLYNDLFNHADRRWDEPGVQDLARAQLVGDLRRAASGGWDSAGMDLALALAADRFGLAVTVIEPGRGRYALTEQGTAVTLVRPNNSHWDAALPAALAHGQPGSVPSGEGSRAARTARVPVLIRTPAEPAEVAEPAEPAETVHDLDQADDSGSGGDRPERQRPRVASPHPGPGTSPSPSDAAADRLALLLAAERDAGWAASASPEGTPRNSAWQRAKLATDTYLDQELVGHMIENGVPEREWEGSAQALRVMVDAWRSSLYIYVTRRVSDWLRGLGDPQRERLKLALAGPLAAMGQSLAEQPEGVPPARMVWPGLNRGLRDWLADERAAARAAGASQPGTEAHRAWRDAMSETDIALAPVWLNLSLERTRSQVRTTTGDALRTLVRRWREQDYPDSVTAFWGDTRAHTWLDALRPGTPPLVADALVVIGAVTAERAAWLSSPADEGWAAVPAVPETPVPRAIRWLPANQQELPAGLLPETRVTDTHPGALQFQWQTPENQELASWLAAEKAAARAADADRPGTEAHMAWQRARQETDAALATERLMTLPRPAKVQVNAMISALQTYVRRWRELGYPDVGPDMPNRDEYYNARRFVQRLRPGTPLWFAEALQIMGVPIPQQPQQLTVELASWLAAEKAAARAADAGRPGTEAHMAWQRARQETDAALEPERLRNFPRPVNAKVKTVDAMIDGLQTYVRRWRELGYPDNGPEMPPEGDYGRAARWITKLRQGTPLWLAEALQVMAVLTKQEVERLTDSGGPLLDVVAPARLLPETAAPAGPHQPVGLTPANQYQPPAGTGATRPAPAAAPSARAVRWSPGTFPTGAAPLNTVAAGPAGPAAGSRDDVVQAALDGHDEVLVPIRADGLCLARALLTVAAEPLGRAGITRPEQVYPELAAVLEARGEWGSLEVTARLVWADSEARAQLRRLLPRTQDVQPDLYNDLFNHAYGRWDEPGVQDLARAQLVGDLRRAASGGWDSAGMDLALALAADRFGLAVTVIEPGRGRYALTEQGTAVTLVRPNNTHWDAALPAALAHGQPGSVPSGDSSRAARTARVPVIRTPAERAEVAERAEPAETVHDLDQARRRRVRTQAAAEPPLGEDEDLRITGWDFEEYQLHYRPEIDQQFPWRDPAAPLHKVYRPYAAADGSLHPQITLAQVRMPQPRELQRMAASRTDRRLGALDWADIRARLTADVHDLIQATITGQYRPPRMTARILSPADLLEHEAALQGQYGTFLTPEMLTAVGADRPLLRNGRVLGLYAAAVLDSEEAREQWRQAHGSAGSHTIDAASGIGSLVTFAGEGYSGAVGFTNARLLPDQQAYDQSYETGINTAFVAFEVNLTIPDRRSRWRPIIALVGLDNLYDNVRNPAGMLLTDYGDAFLMKPEPSSP
jgi:hypothetical protein